MCVVQWVANEFLFIGIYKVFQSNLIKNSVIVYNFFLPLNTKEDISKNMGNRTVDGPHWLPQNGKNYNNNTMDVNES